MPFSINQFPDVFVAYNAAIWPAQTLPNVRRSRPCVQSVKRRFFRLPVGLIT